MLHPRPKHHPSSPDADRASEALLRLAAGGSVEGPLTFDGADVSAAALAGRSGGAAWWDEGLGGLRLSCCALAGASLRRADLSGADLSKADLSKASCSGIVLRRARLEEARLGGADLIGGVLDEVDAGEADFSASFLEDASLKGARLRFADFTDAAMDGADLSGADLWGAKLGGCAAERASFRDARLDEAHLEGADLASADFTGATLRRAKLHGTILRGAILRDTVLDGASLADADLGGALMPHLSLIGCDLRHARFAGAWLDRTRLRAHQIGGATGEEVAGEFEAARDAYIVLEQNFRSLGSAEDASWAFRRRRRMGKRLHAERARGALVARQPGAALRPGSRWVADVAAEWVCDYGESLVRVLRTFLVVLICFAGVYWAAGCLEVREPKQAASGITMVNYLLFSLDSMTTVGTSDVALRPNGQLGVLLSSVQTVVGTVLLGLLGFVLGGRMRNSA